MEEGIKMSKERWGKGLDRHKRVEKGGEGEGSYCLTGN